MGNAGSLIGADRRHVWHPYAPTVGTRALPLVRDARGVRLELTEPDGTERTVVDAMSSWWCAIHGYRHPVMDAALAEAAGAFAHVMFGGLTHEPGVRLAVTLAEMAAEAGFDLPRVFLADSGSVAVEVALKLVRQVQAARHGPGRRTRVAALRGGYHGDTLGAMAVCDPVRGMHRLHADALSEQVFLPRPPRLGCRSEELARWHAAVVGLVAAHAHELAAVICEPVLQGAGGMWTYDPAAIAVLRGLCDRHGLLLVADEIATGFGRTGTLFACERAGIAPDVLVVGKALTGGYVTQAAVLAREELAAEVSRGPGGALMHGPTFMANPLASSLSLASLGIVRTGDWAGDVSRIESALDAGLAPLRTSPVVADVRVLGATGAVELDRDVDLALATRVALDHGVWLRPFGRCVYAMPPYIASPADLATIVDAVAAVVRAHEEGA